MSTERADFRCPNRACRALLGTKLGKDSRTLRLTSGATAPDRGFGYWWVECKRCRQRRRWWGRIEGD